MAAVGEALHALSLRLYNLGLRAPWLQTGIRSTPEWLHFLPDGTEYRKVAPGSQVVKAIIPGDVPQLVYNIRYYGRDYRRAGKYTSRTVATKEPFDFDKMYASAPLKPADIKEIPRPGAMVSRHEYPRQ
ncbi:hypothetical protein FOA52_001083 [Chlamydomonas sp. UWO 241]|nr:hypothetical protein FOA52_001083 [Chlamydomonas sp. UWO 241]